MAYKTANNYITKPVNSPASWMDSFHSPLLAGVRFKVLDYSMKRLTTNLLTIMLLLATSFFAKANDESAGGIVYGSDWAFVVQAPDGWIMNTKTGLGVSTAFLQQHPVIPQNSQIPPALMYITVSSKNKNDPDLDALINHDKDAFIKTSPDLIISSRDSLKTGDKRLAKVLSFKNTSSGRPELVAYQDYDNKMYKFVITASSDEELTQQATSFSEMIESFNVVRNGVKFEKQ